MVPCNPKSFALALLLGVLPMGFACAGGGGRGGVSSGAVIGGGVGAVGAGSAAVGGGAPVGRVGGGPPAGAVGGGLPGRMDPGGNGAAGTGNPGLNALGAGSGTGTNEPGIPNSKTLGGAAGGLGYGSYSTGVTPAAAPLGGAAPAASSGTESTSNASGNKEAPSPNLASPPPSMPFQQMLPSQLPDSHDQDPTGYRPCTLRRDHAALPPTKQTDLQPASGFRISGIRIGAWCVSRNALGM
jgi:hypothetical protein